jgi:hypothetical protein
MDNSFGLKSYGTWMSFVVPASPAPLTIFMIAIPEYVDLYAFRSIFFIFTGLANPELSNKTGYCRGNFV